MGKMKPGEHVWDGDDDLRTRCTLTLELNPGSYKLFTAGKTPLATATLMPDGKTLDIVIVPSRVLRLVRARKAQ